MNFGGKKDEKKNFKSAARLYDGGLPCAADER